MDATTGEIATHVLTDGHADDAAQVPDLLRQLDGALASLLAEGACDTEPATAISSIRLLLLSSLDRLRTW